MNWKLRFVGIFRLEFANVSKTVDETKVSCAEYLVNYKTVEKHNLGKWVALFINNFMINGNCS